MTDRELADVICRALLAIVSGIRKRYNLPDRHNIVIVLQEIPPDELPDKWIRAKDITLPKPAEVTATEGIKG